MKVSRFVARFAVVVAIVCASVAHAGINAWTAEGPFSAVSNQIAVDSSQPNNLLLSTPNGLYRSGNAGVDWALVRADFSNPGIAFDSAHPGRVYVTYNGIHRSDNGGITFSELPAVAGRPVSIGIAANGDLYGINGEFALARSSDLGQTWTVLPRPWAGNQRVEFALDPNDANVVYVYINDVGTYRSGDRGATWAPPTAGSPGTNVGVQAPRDVWSFIVQPGNSSRIVATTGGGIRISSDAGATWSTATPFRFAYWVGFHPTQPQRAIAIGLHGEIMRSEDGGATWPLIQDGADTRVYSFSRGALDPSTPDRVWATSANGPIVSSDWGDTFALRTGDLRMGDVADFASADDGTTFAAFRSPIGIYRRNGSQWNPLDISTLFAGYSPGVGIQNFAVAPGNSSVLYVSNIDRAIARSLDGGDSWVVRALDFPAPNVRAFKLFVSPLDANVVFAATSSDGAWRSIDGGFTWIRVAGLPAWVNAIAFDPANPGVIYAGAGGFMPDTVFKSTNGGANWAPTGALPTAGLSGVGIPNSIVIDPTDSNIVYVTAQSHLYKSSNAGASWASLDMGGNPNLPLNSNLLLIDPLIPTTLFASASPGVQTISRSVDGGSTWEPLPFSGGNTFTFMYRGVLDPVRPNRVIANPSMLGLMTFEVSPDLALSLTGFDAPLLVGSNAAASIVVRNRGPFASSASAVRITLPAWLTPTVPPDCSLAANTLTCRLGALRVNQDASIPLTLAVAAMPGVGAVTVTVEGHETDSDTSNDSATINASSARYADLQLAVTQLAGPIGRTTSARLTSELRNAGPSAAPATQVVYNVPAGIAVVGATSTIGTCATAGVTVTCTLGDLALDAAATIQLDLRGDVHGSYVVVGNAASQAIDGNGTQSALANVTVAVYGDASVQVTESAGTKVAGTPYTYSAVVRNDGPDAMNLVASLTLAGATVTATTATGGTCTFTTARGECAFTAFPAGSQATLTVTANAAVAGSVTANGLVFVNAVDPATANNTASVASTVTAPPTPSASSGGGKGGGGALDWLGLLALGSLAAARRKHAKQPGS